jgi:chorismate--pyruvate lyase
MKWHRANPFYFSRLSHDDRQLLPWLQDKGSLTRRLIHLSEGHFEVELLGLRWGRARLDEARALGIDPRHRCLLREVLLLGQGTPWVYARSILPTSSLSGSLGYLKRLGTRPLGALLFSDPCMSRGPMEIAQIEEQMLPVIPDRDVWGRRSVFCLAGQPLLVSEMFLPAFVTFINCHCDETVSSL